MDIRTITPNVAVSGQIDLAEIADIASAGFKAIIINRPDGEEAGQPGSDEIIAAAEAAGLDTLYLPVTMGQITSAHAVQFREAVVGFDKPVLAYCKSGTRSAHLWALAARDRLSTDEVVRMALTAGYDLEAFRPRLEVGE